MTIMKSIMHPNFEEPRSRDRDSETPKLKKLPIWSRKCINSLIDLLNAER